MWTFILKDNMAVNKFWQIIDVSLRSGIKPAIYLAVWL